jgi:uncharacterized protein
MIVAITTLALPSLHPSPGLAQTGYPTATDPYINDYAQVLTAEDAASIRSALTTLRAEQGLKLW